MEILEEYPKDFSDRLYSTSQTLNKPQKARTLNKVPKLKPSVF